MSSFNSFASQQQYNQMQQSQHQLSSSGGNFGQQQHPQQIISPPAVSSSLSKCDQIIYEAITKACEIVVRGRCTTNIDNDNNNHRNYYHGGNQQSGRGGASVSGRFNIEVNEVSSIRTSQTMQAWKQQVMTAAAAASVAAAQQQRSVNNNNNIVVPLRLDVYYEHTTPSFDPVTAQVTSPDATTTPQRELLERWCFDYSVPPSSSSSTSLQSSPQISPYSSRIITTGIAPLSSSTSAYSAVISSSSGTSSTSTPSSSSSSQLRQLCKRIVVLLRTIHCMTRMLPSHRLRNILLSDNNKDQSSGRMMLTTSNPNMYDQEGGDNRLDGNIGTIGYTIYHLNNEYDDLFALPSPSFIYQSFPSIPTPGGGILSIGVMYDVTLEPECMMNELISEYKNNSWKQQQKIQQQQQFQQHRGWQEGVSQLLPLGEVHDIEVEQIQQQQEEQWQINHYPQQQQQQQQQYFSSANHNPSLYSLPIPIVGQHVTSGKIGMNYNGNSNNGNNTNNINNDMPFRSSSLGNSGIRYGGGGRKIQRPRAVSDFIITDYQSISPNIIRPNNNNSLVSPGGTLPTIISQRAMSGLSLAMMNQEGVTIEGGALHQQQQPLQHNNVDLSPPPPPPPNDDDEWSSSVLPYGSTSTRRVAFHTPAPTADEDEQQLRARSYSERGEGSITSHFFHKHGGYGYGYNNGSNTTAVAAPPSPTAPRRPSDVYGTSGTLVRPTGTTPPLPTLMVNRSSSGSIRSRSGSISGTPPPPTSSSVFLAGSRQHSGRTVTSSLADSSNSNTKKNHHRSSSSSSSVAHLSPFLSPITSLDMLQTSPFSASYVQRKSITTVANNKEDVGSVLSSSNHPLLGPQQHQDEMTVFLKSIPRMVPSSSSSMEERCNNTINNSSNIITSTSALQQTESEELQFAVDISTSTTTTATTVTSQRSSLPKSLVATTSQSLWGGTIEGTISGPSDMANTLAVSSLAHRCNTDGKIRLKMFDVKKNSIAHMNKSVAGAVVGGGVSSEHNNNAAFNSTSDPQLSSIEDQLSDFRSFGISLK